MARFLGFGMCAVSSYQRLAIAAASTATHATRSREIIRRSRHSQCAPILSRIIQNPASSPLPRPLYFDRTLNIVRCFGSISGDSTGESGRQHARDQPQSPSAGDVPSESSGSAHPPPPLSLSPVLIRNTQKRLPINKERMRRAVEDIMRALPLPLRTSLQDCAFRVEVLLCSEKRMSEMNGTWRGKRATTDVLSFPDVEIDWVEEQGRGALGLRGKGPVEAEAGAEAEAVRVGHHLFIANALRAAAAAHAASATPAAAAAADRQRGPLLGTIVLAPSYVQRQCDECAEQAQAPGQGQGQGQGQEKQKQDERGVAGALATEADLQRRMALLLVHSLLHLLGFDHETERDWRRMVREEEQVLRRLGPAWLED